MRRKKTLRRALLFLLLLAAALQLHALRLSPTQSIRAAEERYGLEPTEIVAERDGTYLSENQHVLLLTQHRPVQSAFWREDLSPPVEKSGGPVCGSISFRWNSDDPDKRYHLFGTLDLAGAASVVAYCDLTKDYNGTPLRLTAEVNTNREGRQYFWSLTILPNEENYVIPQYLDVLDKDGNTLFTTQISW